MLLLPQACFTVPVILEWQWFRSDVAFNQPANKGVLELLRLNTGDDPSYGVMNRITVGHYRFFNKLTYNEKDGSKWNKDNVKIFFESDDFSKVISTFAERKLLKLRKIKSVKKGWKFIVEQFSCKLNIKCIIMDRC